MGYLLDLPCRSCLLLPAPRLWLAAALAPFAMVSPSFSKLAAQGSSIHPRPPLVAHAAERASPITIDGRLDEAAWTAATPISDFTQQDPNEGQPATQRTEVRFLYDAEAVYVAARMYDSLGARGVSTLLTRRDGSTQSDWIFVAFDTFHDHLGRTFFQTNPAGVKFDALGVGGSNPDPSWDAIWEVSARIDSLGWTAEFRIPHFPTPLLARPIADLGTAAQTLHPTAQRDGTVGVVDQEGERRARVLRASRRDTRRGTPAASRGGTVRRWAFIVRQTARRG